MKKIVSLECMKESLKIQIFYDNYMIKYSRKHAIGYGGVLYFKYSRQTH